MLNYFLFGAGGQSSSSIKYIETQSQLDSLSLSEGDTVLFKSGEIFNNVSIPVGVSATFGSFGTGDKPILSGHKALINSWTNDSGNLWKTSLTDTVKWVFIDGACAEIAQLESDIIGVPGTDQIRISDTPATSLTGAKIIIQKWVFRFEQISTVLSNSGNIITISEDHNLTGNYEMVVIYDHKDLLTSEDQWYYDDILNELWIYSTTDPNLKAITYTTIDYGFQLTTGISNISIQDLELKNFYKSGIYGKQNNNLKVLNNNIHDIRTHGIYTLQNITGAKYNGNTLTDIGCNGIQFDGLQNSQINNNTGLNIGRQSNKPFFIDFPNVLRSAGVFIASSFYPSDTSAVQYQPDTLTINNNDAENMSYMGILLVGDNHSLDNNNIRDINQYFEDGGAFYFFGSSAYSGLSSTNNSITNSQCRIDTNIAGTYGIYFDDGVVNSSADTITINRYGTVTSNRNKDGSNTLTNITINNL